MGEMMEEPMVVFDPVDDLKKVNKTKGKNCGDDL
jgi:PleD family two-component response regulator